MSVQRDRIQSRVKSWLLALQTHHRSNYGTPKAVH